jgi:outer membrane protein assembly factor BamB
MIGQLGVFPHNTTYCSPVTHGDLMYVITSNGVDDTHKNVPAPDAPDIVCLNKHTGEVVWKANPSGANTLHGQWANPAVAEANGRGLVIAPLGDGWAYGFDAKTGKVVWKFDANPKDSIYPQTRNELVAAPVIAGDRMYIATGQDPEHGTGYGRLWCVDITKEGDVSKELPADPEAGKPRAGELLAPANANVASRRGVPNPNSAVVWEYAKADANGDGKFQEPERMHRTISTVAVYNGLVFAPDYSGYLHCLDARTGEVYWGADLEADVWASPLVVGGKVYLPDGDGDVHIFDASRVLNQIAVHNVGSAVYATPVYANGVLYVMSLDKLCAIGPKE